MLFFTLLIFNFTIARAESCITINSYKDFYHCTLQKHPKFEISKLKLKEGEALLAKASQFENPEIGVKSVGGNFAGESIGTTELSLSVSLSQLWKRGPTQRIAEAEKKILDIESQQMLLTVKKNLIRELYRLRQIDVELELVEETLNAFATIQRQYRARLAKGPEQEITLSLVELASGDYELKKYHLVTEKSEILSQLKAIWGPDFKIKNSYLPPPKRKWPDISNKAAMNKSFEIQKFAAETERAIAELGVAKSESWPSVAIGPIVERNTDGPKQFYSFGVNATFTLPLLTINGGARNLANAKLQQSKLLSDYAIQRSQTEKEILIYRYMASIESLKKSPSREDVTKKHTRVDNLFKQGLASGGLVIEAHRQINEFTAAQHEHENAAVEAYLEIKTLSNEDIEEILN